MSDESSGVHRRTVLQAAAGIVVASQIRVGHAAPGVAAPVANGKAGDFGFLSGEWKISHRQLKEQQWDRYEGEASVHAILGGLVSVEELRIPSRNFHGMGLRVLDIERGLWADYWVNSKNGRMDPAPAWGSFVDGVGRWDTHADGVITRGVWDQITARSCRWSQMRSLDAGKTWEENWVMQWARV